MNMRYDHSHVVQAPRIRFVTEPARRCSLSYREAASCHSGTHAIQKGAVGKGAVGWVCA